MELGTETTYFKLARINKRFKNPVTLKSVNPNLRWEPARVEVDIVYEKPQAPYRQVRAVYSTGS